jgi:nanoRNase/pAp phosphatase (c-di-AMP/oligoRNAs hydrolase)
MGAWGTGIFDGDTPAQVREGFILYLGEKGSSKKATEKMLAEYLDEFDEKEDLDVLSSMYIGLAAVQLEIGCLQDDVRKCALEFIDRGADLELWREADEAGYRERKQVLEELKQKLLDSSYK